MTIELTLGSMCFGGGILGAVICLLLFMLSGGIFRRQRKRLLEKLQNT